MILKICPSLISSHRIKSKTERFRRILFISKLKTIKIVKLKLLNMGHGLSHVGKNCICSLYVLFKHLSFN